MLNSGGDASGEEPAVHGNAADTSHAASFLCLTALLTSGSQHDTPVTSI